MTENTLTILISHRLGFSKLADQIIVFDNGSICEQGKFEDLMEKKGLFHTMYEEQRSWYQ
jgi:ABC-type multidrug transport system fused ATPase/permease subunit